MRTQTILSVTGLTVLTSVVGYAIYFDYKRRNDPAFRSALRRDKKRTHKALQKQTENHKKEVAAAIEEAVRSVNEPGSLPSGVEDKERIFMQSVQQGEILLAQGSPFHLQAAKSFFRAFKVYPQPIELIGIYQKAVPDEVFNIIMEMVAKDATVNAGGTSAPINADPFAALAATAARNGSGSASLEEIDEDSPANKNSSPPSGTSSAKGSASAPSISSGETGGEASSQEWETVSKDAGESGVESLKAAPQATSSSTEKVDEVDRPAHDYASAPTSETAPVAITDTNGEESVLEQ